MNLPSNIIHGSSLHKIDAGRLPDLAVENSSILTDGSKKIQQLSINLQKFIQFVQLIN